MKVIGCAWIAVFALSVASFRWAEDKLWGAIAACVLIGGFSLVTNADVKREVPRTLGALLAGAYFGAGFLASHPSASPIRYVGAVGIGAMFAAAMLGVLNGRVLARLPDDDPDPKPVERDGRPAVL